MRRSVFVLVLLAVATAGSVPAQAAAKEGRSQALPPRASTAVAPIQPMPQRPPIAPAQIPANGQPGTFDVMVGGSSVQMKTATLEVVAR